MFFCESVCLSVSGSSCVPGLLNLVPRIAMQLRTLSLDLGRSQAVLLLLDPRSVYTKLSCLPPWCPNSSYLRGALRCSEQPPEAAGPPKPQVSHCSARGAGSTPATRLQLGPRPAQPARAPASSRRAGGLAAPGPPHARPTPPRRPGRPRG